MSKCDILQHLKKGRENIERGWCKKAFRDPHGNVCAVGSVKYTKDGKYADPFIFVESLSYLTKAIAPHYHIPSWNDSPNRTKKHVLAAFDKAAELVVREIENEQV